MYKVKFTKVRNTHDRLRTDIIEGEAESLPTIGKCFEMVSVGLDFGLRYINTSVVKHIEEINNQYQIHTESGSVYMVEIVNPPIPNEEN